MRRIPLNSQIPLILAFLALSPFDGLLNGIRGQGEEKCDFDSLNVDEASLTHVCNEKSSKENSFIYCNGPLLKAVNYHQLLDKGDSKNFVDRPMKFDAGAVQEQFELMFGKNARAEDLKKDELQAFLVGHFLQAADSSTALQKCDSKLFEDNKEPASLAAISDGEMRVWAFELNRRFADLCKVIDKSANNPKRNSLIRVEHPFIVPGGRFREYYYWDSYWSIKGLLASNLNGIAKGMIQNFGQLVNQFGFVPNGGRVYYMMRSQPPLLISMFYDYFHHTRDFEFLKEMLPTLEKELNFWKEKRSKKFTKDGKEYEMYQYRTESTVPRPESFCADVKTAQKLKEKNKAKDLWHNLASAAESGWDFSSRWMSNPDEPKLEEIITTQIVPVDLNAYICGNLIMLSELYLINGDREMARKKFGEYKQFRENFKQVFLVTGTGKKTGWYDFNLVSNQNNERFYASMAVPLFTRCYDRTEKGLAIGIFKSMKEFGAFDSPNGIPTSTKESGQQWDFPNIWPPLNHMIIQGLRRTRVKELQDEALKLAKQWLLANYRLYKGCEEKPMWEKLSAKENTHGGGGEYEPQHGFGWSNGAVLDLLLTYKEEKEMISKEDIAKIEPKQCFKTN